MRWQTGYRPAHTPNPILTIFGMWGGPQDVFLSFEFWVDRSPNFGATGVKNRPFPLTRHIAYTTACSYRSSCDTHASQVTETCYHSSKHCVIPYSKWHPEALRNYSSTLLNVTLTTLSLLCSETEMTLGLLNLKSSLLRTRLTWSKNLER